MYPTSFAQLFLRLTNVNKKWLEILPNFRQLKIKKNTILSGVDQFLFFLEEGTIHTSFTTVTGIEWIFIFQKHGCLFNELSVFNSPIKFQYTANTPCVVRQIPLSYISSTDFIENYPELYINFIETLALKESISYSYFSDLAYSSAKSKVCQAILALAKEQGDTEFCPGITQAEIGSMMGLHQTSVARVINQLRQENVIGTFTKNKINIINIEKLEVMSKEELSDL